MFEIYEQPLQLREATSLPTVWENRLLVALISEKKEDWLWEAAIKKLWDELMENGYKAFTAEEKKDKVTVSENVEIGLEIDEIVGVNIH